MTDPDRPTVSWDEYQALQERLAELESEAEDDTEGDIVYILTNRYMPGLIKIGVTSNQDVRVRVRNLYTTEVPVPFDIVRAVRVDPTKDWEKRLHRAFDSYRVNPRREFFEMPSETVTEILDGIAIEDVTPTDGMDEVLPDPPSPIRKRKPPLRLSELGINRGDRIVHRKSGDEAEVISDSKLLYEGDEWVLSRLTAHLFGSDGYYSVRNNWFFNGKLLGDIEDELGL